MNELLVLQRHLIYLIHDVNELEKLFNIQNI